MQDSNEILKHKSQDKSLATLKLSVLSSLKA